MAMEHAISAVAMQTWTLWVIAYVASHREILSAVDGLVILSCDGFYPHRGLVADTNLRVSAHGPVCDRGPFCRPFFGGDHRARCHSSRADGPGCHLCHLCDVLGAVCLIAPVIAPANPT